MLNFFWGGSHLRWFSTGSLIEERSHSQPIYIYSKTSPLQTAKHIKIKTSHFQAWTTAWLASSCFWHEKCLSTLSLTIFLLASLLLCPGSGKTIHHLAPTPLLITFLQFSSQPGDYSRKDDAPCDDILREGNTAESNVKIQPFFFLLQVTQIIPLEMESILAFTTRGENGFDKKFFLIMPEPEA